MDYGINFSQSFIAQILNMKQPEEISDSLYFA
jgi:hypothetical protein